MDKDFCVRFTLIINNLADGKSLNLAKMLRVTTQTISEVKNGRRILGANSILILLKEFHISIDWLLCGKGNMYLTEDGSNNVDRDKLFAIAQGKFVEDIRAKFEEEKERIGKQREKEILEQRKNNIIMKEYSDKIKLYQQLNKSQEKQIQLLEEKIDEMKGEKI